jgi:hypothetical protein
LNQGRLSLRKKTMINALKAPLQNVVPVWLLNVVAPNDKLSDAICLAIELRKAEPLTFCGTGSHFLTSILSQYLLGTCLGTCLTTGWHTSRGTSRQSGFDTCTPNTSRTLISNYVCVRARLFGRRLGLSCKIPSESVPALSSFRMWTV